MTLPLAPHDALQDLECQWCERQCRQFGEVGRQVTGVRPEPIGGTTDERGVATATLGTEETEPEGTGEHRVQCNQDRQPEFVVAAAEQPPWRVEHLRTAGPQRGTGACGVPERHVAVCRDPMRRLHAARQHLVAFKAIAQARQRADGMDGQRRDAKAEYGDDPFAAAAAEHAHERRPPSVR